MSECFLLCFAFDSKTILYGDNKYKISWNSLFKLKGSVPLSHKHVRGISLQILKMLMQLGEMGDPEGNTY